MHSMGNTWQGFEWIDFHDADNSVVCWLRHGTDGSVMVFAVNATPVPRPNYRVGVPGRGFYREVVNSDAASWGGSNVGNLGGVKAERINCHARDWSINLQIPPLGTVGLKWEKPTDPDPDEIPAKGARSQTDAEATALGNAPHIPGWAVEHSPNAATMESLPPPPEEPETEALREPEPLSADAPTAPLGAVPPGTAP